MPAFDLNLLIRRHPVELLSSFPGTVNGFSQGFKNYNFFFEEIFLDVNFVFFLG